MASTLDATVGGASANAYATLAEANAYYADRPPLSTFGVQTTWGKAANVEKTAALLWSTKLLDRLIVWTGQVVTYTQALQWPRFGMSYRNGDAVPIDAIPADLKDATAEYAGQLLTAQTVVAGDAEAERLRKIATAARKHGIGSVQVNELSLTMNDSLPASSVPEEVRQLLPREWRLSASTIGLVRA